MSEEVKDAVSIAVVSTQLGGLKELMVSKLDNQDGQLTLIKEQTTKTNGHVADAFKKIDSTNREIELLNAFKNKVVGALIISNIVIVPILMFLLFQRLR